MSDDITLDMLREFIKKFGASLDPRVWADLIREELQELREELSKEPMSRVDTLKEATDLMYVTIGFNLVSAGAEKLGLFSDEEHKELMTLLTESSKTYEKAIEILGDLNYIEAFRRVHLSNMSKLGDDGKPIKREDGKVLKGPNYQPPVMWTEIYVAESDDNNYWTVVNETSITGHRCISVEQSQHSAVLLAEAMNEVYNQIKKDIENGYIRCKTLD